jgi:hypothetical protein
MSLTWFVENHTCLCNANLSDEKCKGRFYCVRNCSSCALKMSICPFCPYVTKKVTDNVNVLAHIRLNHAHSFPLILNYHSFDNVNNLYNYSNKHGDTILAACISVRQDRMQLDDDEEYEPYLTGGPDMVRMQESDSDSEEDELDFDPYEDYELFSRVDRDPIRTQKGIELTDELDKFFHLRAYHCWKTVPSLVSMFDDYEELPITDLHSDFDIRNIHDPFKSASERFLVYHVLQQGSSYSEVDKWRNIVKSLVPKEVFRFPSSSTIERRIASIRRNTRLTDTDTISTAPMIPLKLQLSLFFGSKFNCSLHVHKYQEPADNRIRSVYHLLKFKEEVDKLPSDVRLIYLDLFIDSYRTSEMYVDTKSQTGTYVQISNVPNRFQDHSDNMFCVLTGPKSINHLDLSEDAIIEIENLYEPFYLWNALENRFVKYAVRLNNLIFDTPERSEQTDTYGSNTGDHNCSKCLTHISNFNFRFDQLNNIQFRSLDHRDETIRLYVVNPENATDTEKVLVRKMTGYNYSDDNPLIRRGVDVYTKSRVDIMHLDPGGSGLIKDEFKNLFKNLSEENLFILQTRIDTNYRTKKLSLFEISEWDALQWDRFIRYIPLYCFDLFTPDNYTSLCYHAILYLTVSMYYVNSDVEEIALHFNELYKDSILKIMKSANSSDNTWYGNKPNFHNYEHLLKELLSEGPCRNYWTQRYEKFHKTFKKLFRQYFCTNWVMSRYSCRKVVEYLHNRDKESTVNPSQYFIKVEDGWIPVTIRKRNIKKDHSDSDNGLFLLKAIECDATRFTIGDYVYCSDKELVLKISNIGYYVTNESTREVDVFLQCLEVDLDYDKHISGCPSIVSELEESHLIRFESSSPLYTAKVTGKIYLNWYD